MTPNGFAAQPRQPHAKSNALGTNAARLTSAAAASWTALRFRRDRFPRLIAVFLNEHARIRERLRIPHVSAALITDAEEAKAALQEKSDLLPLLEVGPFRWFELATRAMSGSATVRTPHRERVGIVLPLERLAAFQASVRNQVRRKRDSRLGRDCVWWLRDGCACAVQRISTQPRQPARGRVAKCDSRGAGWRRLHR